MAAPSPCYKVLNDEQKQILGKYFDKGMTSTGPNMQAVIAEAASKADISSDKVKVIDFNILLFLTYTLFLNLCL